MKRALRVTIMCMVGALCASRGMGAFAPSLNLAELTEHSDLIVLGSVQSVSPVGARGLRVNGVELAVQGFLAQIVIDRVLKGEPASSMITCEYVLPEQFNGYAGLSAGSYRLLFLKAERNTHVFANPYYPSLPAVVGQLTPVGETLDKVASVVAAALRSPTVPDSAKEGLIWQLAKNAPPQLKGAFRDVAMHGTPNVKFTAVAALLQQNDLEALASVEQALMDPPPGISPGVLQLLRAGLQRVGATPAAEPTMVRLLRANAPETRYAAAAALRLGGAPRSIPYLVTALDDSDFRVRYTAVIALSEITGDKPHGPSMDAFRQNEVTYVTYWKQWSERR